MPPSEPDPQLRGGEQPHVDDRLPGSIDGFLDDIPEHLCIDPAEIRLHRDDEHPSEVDRGGTDTHGPVFRGEVAGRAVGLARNDEGAEQCPGAAVSGRLPPAEDIELRLAGGRTDRQGTEHPEECGCRGSPVRCGNHRQPGNVARGYGNACTARSHDGHGPQSVKMRLDWQEPPAAHLEMEMVGGAGSALRAVVEDHHVWEGLSQAQHVGEAAGYALGRMLHGRDGVVFGENGEGIDQHLVAAAVAAFEGQGLLMRRTVVPAQEAGPGFYRGGVGAGQGRDGPRRVELHPDGHPAEFYFLSLYIQQVTVPPRRLRPCGQQSVHQVVHGVLNPENAAILPGK